MNRKGFSMVELMVSITMLAVVMLGIAQLFPRGMGYSTQTRLMAKASSLAQAKAEEMERMAKNHPDLAAGTHTEDVEGYTRSWVIADNTPMRGVKRARIGVTWLADNMIDSVGITIYLYKP